MMPYVGKWQNDEAIRLQEDAEKAIALAMNWGSCDYDTLNSPFTGAPLAPILRVKRKEKTRVEGS